MFSWLKKHFIPHHSNQHRPHILRDESTKSLIALVLFLEIFSFVLPMAGSFQFMEKLAAVLPSVLGELTNDARASENLSALIENPLLNQAAQMKANDMAAKGYFAHTSPEGVTPWYWIELTGYKYEYAGENLAVNFRDSKDVTRAWLASPTHKANIVKGNYTEMGTGVARGSYKGKNSIFVAQVYANPLPVRTAPILPSPVPSVKVEPSRVAQEEIPAGENTVAVLMGQEKTVSDRVLGASVAEETSSVVPDEAGRIPEPKPNMLEKMLASPRNTANVMLSVVFMIIAIVLTLYIFIKARDHHRDLVGNGLAVLAIIGAILAANYEYSYRSLVITESLDYSLEGK